MRNDAGRERCIQTLFLHPVESYRLAEASRLLGMTTAALRREAQDDHAEEFRAGRTWRFPWRWIACLALQRWTLAEIHEALGTDAANALPSLLALRTVTVRLPEYILRALELIAADERRTVDDVLSYELVELAGTVAEEMEPRIPGFRQAYLFPGGERRRVR